MAIGACLAAWCGGTMIAAEIIDRVMAVAAGQVITLSDVRAARELALVSRTGPDPLAPTLEALIERHLILVEVDRYLPPEPDPAAIEQRLEVVRGRAGGPAAFREALARVGMTEASVRELARNDLRIEKYLEQRFASAGQVTDQEIANDYRAHRLEFTRGDTVLPLADVEDAIRARLARERRALLVQDWIRSLRRRAEVTVLYLPGAPP